MRLSAPCLHNDTRSVSHASHLFACLHTNLASTSSPAHLASAHGQSWRPLMRRKADPPPPSCRTACSGMLGLRSPAWRSCQGRRAPTPPTPAAVSCASPGRGASPHRSCMGDEDEAGVSGKNMNGDDVHGRCAFFCPVVLPPLTFCTLDGPRSCGS